MGFFDGLGGDEERSGWRIGPRRRWSGPSVERLDPFAYTDPDDYDVSRLPRPDDEDAADGETAFESHPIPGDKPDPRAQWDGTSGCWIVYDESVGDWVRLTDPLG